LRLLSNPERPVQFVFAGKAHPHDSGGKDMIRQIIHTCLADGFSGRFVYLEDYSMDMARHLVQGVDVWLNAPRRPMEASGTSGMKVSINGGLNCSVLDGWWDEAYRPGVGWAIGGGETYDDEEHQDQVEVKALFDLLENVIVPLFYDRSRDDLPRPWIAQMKESMKTLVPRFNTNRMLAEYADRFYIPCFQNWGALASGEWAGARELAAWREKIRSAWPSIRIEDVSSVSTDSVLTVGDTVPVTVRVAADGVEPDDLAVEMHTGREAGDGWLEDRTSDRLVFQRREADRLVYTGSFTCRLSGSQAFTIRILPSHRRFGTVIEPGLVAWWM
jgi:starch phosphorylase